MSTQPNNAGSVPDPNAQAAQNGGQNNLDFEAIMRVCNFAIELCNAIPVDACEKLNLNVGQKEQIRAMLKEASIEEGKDCMISLPVGLSYTLAALTQMPGTSISTVVLGAFAVMSFLTGQFFLFRIFKQLDQINYKLDRIIDFLENDKKAKLTAHTKITQDADKNYEFIMSNELQRNATIGKLQDARTEAIGNIDFYLNELMNAASIPYGKKNVDLESDCKRVLAGKECLDLSFQLYAMSWILEIYYAQNFEPKYIENVKKDILNDIYSRRDSIRDSFKALSDRLNVAKSAWFRGRTQEERREIRADYRKQVADIIRSLDLPNGDWLSSLTDPVYSALDAVTRKRNYYLSSSGEVYTEKLPE